MANLPTITYKVINSTLTTDAGFNVSNLIFSNVDTQYKRSVQLGEVEADYKCYNQTADIGVLTPYKLSIDGKRIGSISYVIPSDIIREFNPEQFPLVERKMLAATFGIDESNITILVDGVEVPLSVFE